ncbi:MAG: type II toxin-antitoxin system PemK/MazF family toxin [Gammaproteobacteria bacterium]|nr:type II toxin-antitoxin system PemK/MazF family toxin [Gammaproteobacteria bacterium]NBT45406.1 type II toxin-antitoxin system PemK/MazF family toxin [Gammaproteobacteria bacterium]NBY21800.1 type II toxin-antitoxin system PemK/MazF family toxin [Gammaproteobacteria bacterium]NDE35408.1 type II toxin-antitoxin system PemK/MazF family toxin [Gammaproteobacteria bacterium]NDE57372.1 type II toxin-antitoxin system PemK/MazF family toxin [Gammaproteobacteria bacterium]
MKQSGKVVLLPFPYTDLSATKLRPALILRKASREFDDWLVCMVSSQLHQMDEGMDEIVNASDADFKSSGLKAPSVLRLSRLAVVDGALLVGSIGSISDGRLTRVRERLASWIRLDG